MIKFAVGTEYIFPAPTAKKLYITNQVLSSKNLLLQIIN